MEWQAVRKVDLWQGEVGGHKHFNDRVSSGQIADVRRNFNKRISSKHIVDVRRDFNNKISSEQIYSIRKKRFQH